MRAALAVLLAALAVPAVAAASTHFRVPGKNVYCELGEPPKPIPLDCWRATDGKSIAMLPTGKALVNPDTNTKGLHHDTWPVLQFGQTWRGGAYKCTSRPLGVTCTNRSRHGFWLGRTKGYRLF